MQLTKYRLILLNGQLVNFQIVSSIFGHVAVQIRSCRLFSLQEFAPSSGDSESPAPYFSLVVTIQGWKLH